MQHKHSIRWLKFKCNTCIYSVSVRCLWKWLCQWRTTSEETDGFVCHFVSSTKRFLLICSSTLTGENGKWVSVCCWQNHRKVTMHGVVPSVLVIMSLWASLFIPSVPEASNGKWLKRPPPPSLKDLLPRLLGICDMQSIGPEPVKSLLILFCSLFKLCKYCAMSHKRLLQLAAKWRQVVEITRYI